MEPDASLKEFIEKIKRDGIEEARRAAESVLAEAVRKIAVPTRFFRLSKTYPMCRTERGTGGETHAVDVNGRR